MNTSILKIGFFSVIIFGLFSITSCETEEVANATVVVSQEYTSTQGQVYQEAPVENAEVKFYVGLPRTEHIDEIQFTNSNGEVFYTFPYQARIFCDVTVDGLVHGPYPIRLEVGKTTVTEIVLPE